MKTNRRQFLGKALASAGTLVASRDFLWAANDEDEVPPGGGTAKRVIYLLMRGGMSQFETFDLKQAAHQPGSPNQIPTSIPGYAMSEWLPRLAKRMDRCAVIRSMSNRSGGHHEEKEYSLRTSYDRRRTIRHPGMGSWTSWHLAKQKKPHHYYFQIGGDFETAEEWLGPAHAPMLIHHPQRGASEVAFRISGDELDLREKIWTKLNQQYGSKKTTAEFRTGFELIRAGIEEVVDVKKAPLADQVRYGSHPFGQGCLIARRLAEADLSCFTELVLDGWNPPAPYFPQVRERCEILDQALSVLLDDLQKLDLLKETLVVLATPVGRRSDLRNGTRIDNPQAFSCLLAGGGVRGGQVYGETNSGGSRVFKDPVTTHGLNRTIAWALGIDYRETAYSSSGRPFTMGGGNARGEPLANLFKDAPSPKR